MRSDFGDAVLSQAFKSLFDASPFDAGYVVIDPGRPLLAVRERDFEHFEERQEGIGRVIDASPLTHKRKRE
jgi:hypothetical protein